MEIYFFQTSNETQPFVWEYIEALNVKDQAKIVRALRLLKKYGLNRLRSSGDVKDLADTNLLELKVRFANTRYRLIFMIFDFDAWFLHAFPKKSQKIPRKDLNIALKRSDLLKELLVNEELIVFTNLNDLIIKN